MKVLLFIFSGFISCIGISAQDVQSIADSNNIFAFQLYNQINKNNSDNLFFSPFSISTALAMTYAGARNETEKQMRQTLHFNLHQNKFHAEYKSYLQKIESDTSRNVVMGIANSIWVADAFKILPLFAGIIKNDYNAESKNVDFAGHAEQVRQKINSWVEGKTHDKIQELVKRGAINSSTKLALVNAIYFNGKWENSFKKDSTKKNMFLINGRIDTAVEFMHNTAHYRYYENTDLQAVELLYKGGRTSMLILLPKEMNGISNMESMLNYSYYSKITSLLISRKVALALPKFKATTQFELSAALSAMGMPVGFSDAADFSGMSNESLKISAVIHKAFVSVSEEGTEAAAATAAIVGLTSVYSPPKTVAFIANHPFIFIIRDNMTGGILFMGKINDPTKE